MEDIKESIQKKVEAMKGTASPKQIKMQEEALTKIFEEGKPVYEAVGVSKESLEYMYSHAYSLYNVAKYEEARQLFFVLNFLHGEDLRFTYGIAACYHMMKNYPPALAMYLACVLRDPSNPLLYWHVADCYNQMGNKVAALVALQTCINMTQQDSSFEPLKTRAEREFAFLEREVIEEMETKQKKEEAVKPAG